MLSSEFFERSTKKNRLINEEEEFAVCDHGCNLLRINISNGNSKYQICFQVGENMKTVQLREGLTPRMEWFFQE